MYRTYVQGAIPERPFPKLENVALGIEEFGAKPGLKGKRAEDLTDPGLVKELENEALLQSPLPPAAPSTANTANSRLTAVRYP